MSDPKPIRILVVDDHPAFREGVATVIDHEKDMQLVATAATAREAVEAFTEWKPDVTLMDLRLPDVSGISAVASIRAKFPDAKIIMLTTFEGDVDIHRALAAGVRGYMLKSAPLEELVDAIRKVQSGRRHLPEQIVESLAEHFSDETLSGREVEVLQRIAEGDRNRDIGERLSISEDTVKVHIRHIMEKLGARDRTQAVAIAIRRGVIQV